MKELNGVTNYVLQLRRGLQFSHVSAQYSPTECLSQTRIDWRVWLKIIEQHNGTWVTKFTSSAQYLLYCRKVIKGGVRSLFPSSHIHYEVIPLSECKYIYSYIFLFHLMTFFFFNWDYAEIEIITSKDSQSMYLRTTKIYLLIFTVMYVMKIWTVSLHFCILVIDLNSFHSFCTRKSRQCYNNRCSCWNEKEWRIRY